MNLLRKLAGEASGNAAVEMALVTPLLLMLMFGAAELGNYFWNEHTLVKAVRDGARFAARQAFSNYPDCSTVSAAATDSTQNVVIYGYQSAGTDLLTPNISASDIQVGTSCVPKAGDEIMRGIYSDRGASGAQIVTVTARVDYRPILASFGFRGVGMTLNASSQAAVTGL